MSESGPGKSSDHPTLLVRDREGHDLLCFLEHLIPIEGQDYALLSPVDTPVSLFRLNDDAEPVPITEVASSEPILSVADVVLQEHDLVLVRSAITSPSVVNWRSRIRMSSTSWKRTTTLMRTPRPLSCW